jgi:hypothetical protein
VSDSALRERIIFEEGLTEEGLEWSLDEDIEEESTHECACEVLKEVCPHGMISGVADTFIEDADEDNNGGDKVDFDIEFTKCNHDRTREDLAKESLPIVSTHGNDDILPDDESATHEPKERTKSILNRSDVWIIPELSIDWHSGLHGYDTHNDGNTSTKLEHILPQTRNLLTHSQHRSSRIPSTLSQLLILPCHHESYHTQHVASNAELWSFEELCHVTRLQHVHGTQEASLKRIEACSNQTWSNDGGDDDEAKILGVFHYHEDEQGDDEELKISLNVPASLKAGVRVIKGEYIL